MTDMGEGEEYGDINAVSVYFVMHEKMPCSDTWIFPKVALSLDNRLLKYSVLSENEMD
jgi:hypothetical protein